jgi:predicted nucleic acid-binding protein
VAVIRKQVYRGLLTPSDAVGARELLLSKSIHLMMDDVLLRRGYELATRFNRPTAYDAQYLAVAEYLQCEFWTADERLFNAVNRDLTWAKWLGNFVP